MSIPEYVEMDLSTFILFPYDRNPRATILPTIEVPRSKPAPVVAYFSARGPSPLTENILKVMLFFAQLTIYKYRCFCSNLCHIMYRLILANIFMCAYAYLT